jgi:hypothetical protein
MSSSRSIAAARQKRAGEQSSQPMNNSRPITSISSQGAFAQQHMQSQNIPIGGKNGRPPPSRSQNSRGASNMQPQQQQQETTKISLSNAIGLITLRLGRLENYVGEIIEDVKFNNNNNNNNEGDGVNNSIPSNMKLVSDEVFENIVNRLNLLESKIIQFTNQNDTLNKDVTDIKKTMNNFNTILSSFINETNEKFLDYENALAEIEKNVEIDAVMNGEIGTSDISLEIQHANAGDSENNEHAENQENHENHEHTETDQNN